MKKPVPLQGAVTVPADKSISHRSILFSACANGESHVRASLMGRDNLASIRIMRQLGVRFEGEFNAQALAMAEEEGIAGFTESGDALCRLRIFGEGFEGLRMPTAALDCGNSGTTARLLTGLLAGCEFSATLTGDHSLVKRPFRRVTEPLSQMGASFSGDMLPLTMTGGALKGIEYLSPKASAQVKSAILLAGLRAQGAVSVSESVQSRDHTERMLTAMGCAVRGEETPNGRWLVSLPTEAERLPLRPLDFEVPGDFSAAAFPLVAAAVTPGSEVEILGVGFNPTRIGLYHILRRMGADIEAMNARVVGGEEVVDLRVRYSRLHGVEVTADDVVLAIDEIPILAVAAAFADGETLIAGAEELRVKESDRLAMTAQVLQSFGATVSETPDGLRISGKPGLRAQAPSEKVAWRTSGDHRIAMSGAVLQYAACGSLNLSDQSAVETSFPGFLQCFEALLPQSRVR
ncbi:MAG: 3-phosphoshikimate 1-carboxyvinyltransferase [Bdellovibrionales bacterium]|nr:3-phosphoshikimate 1-carboxyvinyltransferase [Bdellovibrionales bacterium]